MKKQEFLLNPVNTAIWLIRESKKERFDPEAVKHLIQFLILSGQHKDAATLVRHLIEHPTLFAECAMTLFETLCENRHAGFARTILPWFECRIKSKRHAYRPCDLYLAIAETTGSEHDLKRAKQSVSDETNRNEQAIRLVQLYGLDPNPTYLRRIRERIQHLIRFDLFTAIRISTVLTTETKEEADFEILCTITSAISAQLGEQESEPFFEIMKKVALILDKKTVRATIRSQSNETVRQHLLQLFQEQSHVVSSTLFH